MNGTPHITDSQLQESGEGWRAFAWWLTGAVIIVTLSLVLSFLGPWAQHRLLRAESASLPTVLGAKVVGAALIACGLTLGWTYFTRAKHSAVWMLRVWTLAFTFGLFATPTHTLPLWFDIVGLVAFACFLYWARRAWGKNWLEMDGTNVEGVDA